MFRSSENPRLAEVILGLGQTIALQGKADGKKTVIVDHMTIMIGGSTKRRNLLTIGFRILDRSLLRSLEIFRLEMVKTAPRRPPIIPRQAAGRNISTFTDMESPTFRTMNFSGSKSPKLALKWKASKDELTMSAVNVANIQQKKIIQPNLIVQNDETSSMANSSPPTGAPKAAATPAAAPAVVKLRLSSEFRNLAKKGRVNLRVFDRN